MRSIFLRIYIGILCAVLTIGGGALLGYRLWNEDRLSEYLANSSQGTLQLISQGLIRHQGERRLQWLALSKRVTALPLVLISAEQLPETFRQQPHSGHLHLTVIDEQRRRLFVPASKDQYEWLQVTLTESDINEQLMRGSQLLLLNELGRAPQAERKATLQRLQTTFAYPLHWLNNSEVTANYLQKRALAQGDTVVELLTLVDSQRAIRTLAPIGNSGDFLQQGPVPLFEPFPRMLVIAAGLLGLALLALTCFLLVRPLARRLGRMADEVDQLQPSGPSNPLTVDGNDALTALAGKINTMSERIHQLLNAQRELNRAVSHELKTPLARLNFRRELALHKLNQLSPDSLDISPVTEHLEGMEGSLQELNSLVEEILLYASMESTAPALAPSPIELNDLLNSLFEPLRNENPALQLSHNAYPGLQLQADPHYLRRALQNLLGNAQRYAFSQIRVTISSQPGQLCLSIEDDGPGIPPEQWQQALEPFSRVESSRNRNSGGSGLGLAIVRQIAHWHQGEIELGHSRLLRGLCARLTLPAPDTRNNSADPLQADATNCNI